MSDLVNELRDWARPVGVTGQLVGPLLTNAADEIERLRALADDLAADLQYAADNLSREFDLYCVNTGSLARYQEARQR